MKIVEIKESERSVVRSHPGFKSWSDPDYPFGAGEILPKEFGIIGDQRFVIMDGYFNEPQKKITGEK